jgi:hypothetical protein
MLTFADIQIFETPSGIPVFQRLYTDAEKPLVEKSMNAARVVFDLDSKDSITFHKPESKGEQGAWLLCTQSSIAVHISKDCALRVLKEKKRIRITMFGLHLPEDQNIGDNGDDEIEPEDDDRLCSVCNGSGEGMHDRTTCWSCGGKGIEPPDEEEMPERDYYQEMKDAEYDRPEPDYEEIA